MKIYMGKKIISILGKINEKTCKPVKNTVFLK